MNTRAFTLSLIIAGLAMFMVYSHIEGRESVLIEKYGKESAVLVAKVDIKELELIDDSKVEIKNVPQNFLAPGHIKDKKAVFNTIATVPILKGEQLTTPRLTFPGARTGVSRQVAVGKRAISIATDNTQSVSKLIKPGDRVDILAMVNFAGGRPDLLSVRTILQDVLVLSTGLSVTNSIPLANIKGGQGQTRTVKFNEYTDYNTITLELDPFQAQKIILLISMGSRIYLSLRNNDDKSMSRIQGTKLFDVLGDEAAEAKSFFSKKEGGN